MAEMRLIDANALIKGFEYVGLGDHSLIESVFAAGVYAGIENAPTIDAVPVVHGQWKLENGWWRCSACREFADGSFNYCPNCGAKMDGGDCGC